DFRDLKAPLWRRPEQVTDARNLFAPALANGLKPSFHAGTGLACGAHLCLGLSQSLSRLALSVFSIGEPIRSKLALFLSLGEGVEQLLSLFRDHSGQAGDLLQLGLRLHEPLLQRVDLLFGT